MSTARARERIQPPPARGAGHALGPARGANRQARTGREARAASRQARAAREARAASRQARAAREARAAGRQARTAGAARAAGRQARSGREAGAAGRQARSGREARTSSRARRPLEGKVAMVTGAGRSAAAVAAALAEDGASVVLGAPDPLAIGRVARQIETGGGRAIAIVTDLGDPRAVARLADEALRVFGRLDLAVNGPGRARGLDDLAEPDCRAVYFAVRHQLPAIAASGGGAIVNVALGPLGWSDDARCVVGLTRATALEQRGGVRVNALARAPGKRGFAAAARWLCSDAARHLNGAVVTGPAKEDEGEARPPLDGAPSPAAA
jgi:short chain dehydrogenase